ncbi:MAG: branched-chain amino acid transaminase [Candidatus Micrarchaeota archaeon]|nr:branched-chain amino acid transaminase [Candidatus Micrarchaeota archaeon]MDE1850117.1 branched-chain amino acid transaminase [Candidatus Micrarchaeota archaeon]MDE1851494.1 branched-chain amino acid transaminase [Candidatus Micrarchaeota archaeon]
MAKQQMWLDGKFVDADNAKVNILTHSLQYGSGIFEGIRAYETANGTAIFRLKDHVKRFYRTASVYMMDFRYTQTTLENAIVGVVKKNNYGTSYIRPFAFYNDTQIGIETTGKKVSIAIANVPFGKYFKDRNKGIRCAISPWQRINSTSVPPQAKASGNYINSILASTVAKRSGYDEAILADTRGYVAEGPGENIFIVEDNVLVTPSKASDILLGITRDSVIKIAENIGIEVEEREVHKEELYMCDEAFFTGTAAEVTPIVSIDSRKIGAGKPGPITTLLMNKYFDIVTGENKEFTNWLTFI